MTRPESAGGRGGSLLAPSRLLLALALCPLVFGGGPKLLTGSIVVGVLALALASWRAGPAAPGRQAMPAPLTLVVLAFGAWAALSVTWSAEPARSLGFLPDLAAIILTAVVGLEAARRLPAGVDRRGLARAAFAVQIGLMVLYAVQFPLGMPLLHGLHAVGLMADDPVPTMLNRGLTFLVLAVWPLTAVLLARGARVAAAALPMGLLGLVLMGESLTAVLALLTGGAAAGAALWLSARLLVRLLALLVAALAFIAPWALTWGVAQVRPGLDVLPFSALARLEILALYADPLAARPLLGWGLFTATRVPRTPMDPEALVTVAPGEMSVHPHNNYVEIWLELGLVGVALLALGALLVVRAIGRMPAAGDRAAAAGALVTALTVALTAYGVWQADWLAQILFTGLLFLVLRPDARAAVSVGSATGRR